MSLLDELAIKYEADKASSSHNYAVKYDRVLSSRRNDVKKLLEIGVFKGGSLRMWKEYFPKAEIYGVDILYDSKAFEEDRIKIFIKDQSSASDLSEISKLGPFDLIIDDGSHLSKDQIFTFNNLWNSVVPGGLYIVEDIATSYWPGWVKDSQQTAIDYFKNLADHANFYGFQSIPSDYSRRESLLVPLLAGKAGYILDIYSVAFFNGFVIIEKAK